MIEKKYIELINKDIDKEITQKEKALLESCLSSNPEAKNLYDELQASESLLDRLPDRGPSVNLKKQILNSIDRNRYSRTKMFSPFRNFIHQAVFQTKYKIAFTFALGLLAGLFIYSVLFNNNQSAVSSGIYGTIGLNSEVIKTIPVETSNILGKLDIKWINNNLGLDFALNSPDQYDLALKFNPDKTKFDNISFYGKNKIKLDSEDNILKLSDSGRHNYQLLFSLKAKMTVNFNLQISRAGNMLLEKDIVIVNN
jgi:hypothetical protein